MVDGGVEGAFTVEEVEGVEGVEGFKV